MSLPQRPEALRIGLTGGLASGKSTVSRWLAEHGFLVVDADRLVAELYEPGEAGAAAVAQLFGSRYLTATGAVDRPHLARLVFSDEAARRALEAQIHPLVRERFAARARAEGKPAVLEATLLVEAGYAPDFDQVLTVEAPAELRFARAVARGLSPEDARARLEAQGDGAQRRATAHLVLHNDGDLAGLHAQLESWRATLDLGAAAPAPRS